MLTVVIQAGGESRRMGQDKALMPFLRRPLIERIVERLQPIADELLVTTNRPQAYSFLGLRLIADLAPGRGALGGLYTALASASHEFVAVIACDMPFASAGLLAYGRDCLHRGGEDVAIPGTGQGWYEPLHAVYRRQTCLAPVRAAVEAGEWKVISWFSQVRVRVLTPEEVSRFDPLGLAFQNLNTPEEFRLAEEWAAALG